MPSTVYTIVFWELSNVGFPSPTPLPGPPAGFVWVIRDVLFRHVDGSGPIGNPNVASLQSNGQAVASTPAYRTVSNVLYEFRDVRQTVTSSDTMTFNFLQAGWDVRVTGYQLTSP